MKAKAKTGETKLTDEQIVNMLSIIADKFGAQITSVDLKQHWIEVEAPESTKVACSVEMGEFLQNITP